MKNTKIGDAREEKVPFLSKKRSRVATRAAGRTCRDKLLTGRRNSRRVRGERYGWREAGRATGGNGRGCLNNTLTGTDEKNSRWRKRQRSGAGRQVDGKRRNKMEIEGGAGK